MPHPLLFVFANRRRATAHESLNHPWICSDEPTIVFDEQTADASDGQQHGGGDDDDDEEDHGSSTHDIVAEHFD